MNFEEIIEKFLNKAKRSQASINILEMENLLLEQFLNLLEKIRENFH